jgi:hypothetical protein
MPGVPPEEDGSSADVEVVSVGNEDALTPSLALASEEVDAFAAPSVVASAGADGVADSDVVMMFPRGPTSASAVDTQTATTNNATMMPATLAA